MKFVTEYDYAAKTKLFKIGVLIILRPLESSVKATRLGAPSVAAMIKGCDKL